MLGTESVREYLSSCYAHVDGIRNYSNFHREHIVIRDNIIEHTHKEKRERIVVKMTAPQVWCEHTENGWTGTEGKYLLLSISRKSDSKARLAKCFLLVANKKATILSSAVACQRMHSQK